MSEAARYSAPGTGRGAGTPVRVMVVDDSAVIRGLTSRWLEQDPEISVVASCANGRIAVNTLKATPCDVVVLDIEMPEMDGLEALPKLLAVDPGVRIVMSSTLTRRNADISLKALSMGAADYVAKPESTRGVTTSDDFRTEIVGKVKALAAARRAGSGPAAAGVPREIRPAPTARFAPQPRPAAMPARLRPLSSAAPGIVAIGSSTGGPQALMTVMAKLEARHRLPVVIAQHMPAMFTTILADHLAKAAGVPCAEARDGELLTPGHIYVAPGDRHLTVRAEGGAIRLALDQRPPVNFCRPSVDPLFSSVAAAFGPRALGLVLTGMGHDGRDGARAIAEAGGSVVAQDEATSVVWGMPGAVATAGHASKILALDAIAPFVDGLTERRAS